MNETNTMKGETMIKRLAKDVKAGSVTSAFGSVVEYVGPVDFHGMNAYRCGTHVYVVLRYKNGKRHESFWRKNTMIGLASEPLEV